MSTLPQTNDNKYHALKKRQSAYLKIYKNAIKCKLHHHTFHLPKRLVTLKKISLQNIKHN